MSATSKAEDGRLWNSTQSGHLADSGAGHKIFYPLFERQQPRKVLAMSTRAVLAGSEKFEVARCTYCEKMYNLEVARGERIDKKAQFYLAIVTLAIGLFSFGEPSALAILSNLRQGYGPKLVFLYLVVGSLATLGALVLLTIFFVLLPRSQSRPYPLDLDLALFDPGGRAERTENHLELIRENALGFAVAAVEYRETNSRKAVWLRRLGIIAVLFLLVLLTLELLLIVA